MDKTYRVLAVDDSAFTLMIISTYLESSEFEVVESVRNGSDAVRRFKEVAPDLVLLDLVMPGMSGEETLREILSQAPHARIVMVSSLGTEDAIKTCLEAGATSFLQKPFAKEDLVDFLRRIVREEA
jgi:two-component system chemotaxis response regulator CheY